MLWNNRIYGIFLLEYRDSKKSLKSSEVLVSYGFYGSEHNQVDSKGLKVFKPLTKAYNEKLKKIIDVKELCKDTLLESGDIVQSSLEDYSKAIKLI
jgi:hypothetical protein